MKWIMLQSILGCMLYSLGMQKKGKVVIQVAGNPQYALRPQPSIVINNPTTGAPSFGQFPAIQTVSITFSGGPIYLRYGRHYETGRGYGFEHIWKARFPQEANRTKAEVLVTQMILNILVSGATIHYEFGLGSQERRSTVFKSHAGVVIVEERLDGKNNVFYSIVTAIDTANAKGSVVGAF
jgi:hypothetical protein